MVKYPTLAEASGSFSYLAGTVRNPAAWNTQAGGQHLWTAWGYLQAQALGETRTMSVEDAEQQLKETHPEQIERGFEALAASGRGEPTVCAIGNGVMLALVGRLLSKFIESGMAEEALRKLLGEWLKQKLPAAV